MSHIIEIEVHASSISKDPDCILEEKTTAMEGQLAQLCNVKPKRSLIITNSPVQILETPMRQVYTGYPTTSLETFPDLYFDNLIQESNSTDILIAGRYYGSCVSVATNRLLMYLKSRNLGNNEFNIHIPTFLIDNGRNYSVTGRFENYSSSNYRDFLLGEISHYYAIKLHVNGLITDVDENLKRNNPDNPINVYYWHDPNILKKYFLES